MDPHERFCHNRDCWAYGRAGEGHIVIHSKKERRYRCKKTFSERKAHPSTERISLSRCSSGQRRF